jgi:hypothetical protein
MRIQKWIATVLFSVTLFLLAQGRQSSAATSNDLGQLQLNVVFHGLFSYIIWPDHIEVLTPQVDQHVYKAGNWGKEFRLKESLTYQLSGVRREPAAPSVDLRNNIILRKITNIDRSPSRLFCSFTLPFPKSMTGLRRAMAVRQQPFFSGAAAANIAPDSLPLLQVLTYQIDDVRQLNLGAAFLWKPEIDNTTHTVNLHIWAEPEVAMIDALQAEHAPDAFIRLMKLFPDVDLHLAFGPGAPPDKSTGIKGMNSWEENTLLERTQLLFPRALTNKTHKGAEVANCVGLIVQNNLQ